MSKNPQEIPNKPGLQYPTNLDALLHADVRAVIRNIYDNLFHLTSSVNTQSTTQAPFEASTFGLSGPHAKRPPAKVIQKNDTYYETDRTVSYINLYKLANFPITAYWKYEFGEMVAPLTSRPTDLKASDAGFLFRNNTPGSGFNNQYRWSGTAWVLITVPVGQIIFVNGAPVTTTQGTVDYNDFLPAAPFGKINIKWQQSGSGPEKISAYIDASSSTQVVYFGTHGTRIAFYDPTAYAYKIFIETDRLSVYVSDGSDWTYMSPYESGMFGTLAMMPTDLGPFDLGFLYQSTEFYRTYVWTGAGWVDASGQPERGVVNWMIQAPLQAGYALCDGSGATMSTYSAGTVFITTPNLIGAFAKGSVMYTGPGQTPAVAPTVSGIISVDLTHFHYILQWTGYAFNDDLTTPWLEDLTLVGSTGNPHVDLMGTPWTPDTTFSGIHSHPGSELPSGAIDHEHSLFSVITDINNQDHDHDIDIVSSGTGPPISVTTFSVAVGLAAEVVRTVDRITSFTDTESQPHDHNLLGSTDTAFFTAVSLDIAADGSHFHNLTEAESDHFHFVFLGGDDTPVPHHFHPIEALTEDALGIVDLDGSTLVVSDDGEPTSVGLVPYLRL